MVLDRPNSQFHGIPDSTAPFNGMGAHSAYFVIQKQVVAKEECKYINCPLRDNGKLMRICQILLDRPNSQFHGIHASLAPLNIMGAHSAYCFIQKQVVAKE